MTIYFQIRNCNFRDLLSNVKWVVRLLTNWHILLQFDGFSASTPPSHNFPWWLIKSSGVHFNNFKSSKADFSSQPQGLTWVSIWKCCWDFAMISSSLIRNPLQCKNTDINKRTENILNLTCPSQQPAKSPLNENTRWRTLPVHLVRARARKRHLSAPM